MKEFKKVENLYHCESCNFKHHSLTELSKHISRNHGSSKEYFDKWLKEENDGKCQVCGHETVYLSFKKRGYRKTCSNKCATILSFKSNLKDTHEKRRKTNLKKYGTEEILSIKKFKEDALMKKYGVKNAYQIPLLRQRSEDNILAKYGVRNTSQVPEILEKIFRKQRKIEKFKDKDIYYQGSYEFDFLEKYFDKIQICRGPRIVYYLDEKKRYYMSDFYIKEINLVIEIKSTYILTPTKNIRKMLHYKLDIII